MCLDWLVCCKAQLKQSASSLLLNGVVRTLRNLSLRILSRNFDGISTRSNFFGYQQASIKYMTLGRIPKNTKLENLINYKVRVTTANLSSFVGILTSYDKYMNLVLNECEEFRLQKKSKQYLAKAKGGEIDETKIKEQKRLLGLVILRGENVVSVVAEAAPNSSTLKPKLRLKKGAVSIKPLMKKLTGNKPDKSNAGVSKPTTRR